MQAHATATNKYTRTLRSQNRMQIQPNTGRQAALHHALTDSRLDMVQTATAGGSLTAWVTTVTGTGE